MIALKSLSGAAGLASVKVPIGPEKIVRTPRGTKITDGPAVSGPSMIVAVEEADAVNDGVFPLSVTETMIA